MPSVRDLKKGTLDEERRDAPITGICSIVITVVEDTRYNIPEIHRNLRMKRLPLCNAYTRMAITAFGIWNVSAETLSSS